MRWRFGPEVAVRHLWWRRTLGRSEGGEGLWWLSTPVETMGGGGGLWWWMGSEGAAASVVVVGALRWYQVRVRGGVVVVVAPVGATGGAFIPLCLL